MSMRYRERILIDARNLGLLPNAEEIRAVMQSRILPKAIEVIDFNLGKNSEKTALAVAKGMGVLVTHQKTQAQQTIDNTLRVIVKTVDGSAPAPTDPRTLTGQIVGRPHDDDEAPSVIRKDI